MNAPIVWIVIPLIGAGILYVLRRFTVFVKITGIAIPLLLALLAWQVPIGSVITLGPWPTLSSLLITENLAILGRQFFIGNDSRSILMIIYIGSVSWMIGATVIPVSKLFIPISLAIAALLVAAISVEPFLYAAFFIQITILLCVPLLSPPGTPVVQGVRRFLIYQVIGMALLIFSGWLVTIVELNPEDAALIFRTTIILGLGFAMTLSVFPFSTWIPMVTEASHPFMAAFVIYTIPEIVSIFTLNTFSRFAWLQGSTIIQSSFTVVGLMMIVGSGLWAIFQNNLGRIFAYAAITEIGLFLVTIGQVLIQIEPVPQTTGNLLAKLPIATFFFALLLPRGLNMAIWALALAIIKLQSKRLDFESTRGIGYSLPVASIGLIVASISLAGYPLFSGFPVRAIIGASMAQQSFTLAFSALIGYSGLMIAALRTTSVLYSERGDQTWKANERVSQRFLLITGCLIILFVGMFSQAFLTGLSALFP
jgi:formate hydrogenlyase subunit 3/multisubunit Na+/H+ antiporter MnhD subunit